MVCYTYFSPCMVKAPDPSVYRTHIYIWYKGDNILWAKLSAVDVLV